VPAHCSQLDAATAHTCSLPCTISSRYGLATSSQTGVVTHVPCRMFNVRHSARDSWSVVPPALAKSFLVIGWNLAHTSTTFHLKPIVKAICCIASINPLFCTN